jgi:chaperone BCS1
MLTLRQSILTWSHHTLDLLVVEAKKNYVQAQEKNVALRLPTDNYWRFAAFRARRSLDTLVLEDGVAEQVLKDAQEFMDSRPWYEARGVPFRRGYLLVRVRLSLIIIDSEIKCFSTVVLEQGKHPSSMLSLPNSF